MSWAKVKKINSNMSMPLDELIKGQRILGASDAIYSVVSSSRKEGTYTYGSFVPKVNGSIRLLVVGHGLNNNSASVNAGSASISITSANNIDIEAYIDIPVNKNVPIVISQSRYASVASIKIGATVIDGSLGEFISN